jgi:hypothetical protein
MFTTKNGRSVFLSDLSMTLTYQGQLEGGKEIGSFYQRKTLREEITRMFRGEAGVVIFDDTSKPLLSLKWIAHFRGNFALWTKDGDHNSCLTVCWFSEELPTDLPAYLQEILDRAEYESNAKDYNFMEI